jgi:hypothetical protein
MACARTHAHTRAAGRLSGHAAAFVRCRRCTTSSRSATVLTSFATRCCRWSRVRSHGRSRGMRLRLLAALTTWSRRRGCVGEVKPHGKPRHVIDKELKAKERAREIVRERVSKPGTQARGSHS